MLSPDQIDVQALLLEIAPGQPCGSNLEYDPEFLALEEALQGKGEVQYGDTIMAAVPPDWKAVHALCIELMRRTRDLRIAVVMTRSAAHFHAMPGLSSGLSLIEELIAQRWEQVHPQLDASDNFDPMMRVNILSSLVDQRALLRELSDAPLVDSRVHGRVTLRDIDIVTGELEADASSKITMSSIDAAFLEIELDALRRTLTALDHAIGSTARIESTVTEKVGAASAISLAPLSTVLKRAADFVRERVIRREEAAAAEAATCAAAGDGVPGTSAGGPTRKASGDISSRADVVRMLEKICTFYATHEPSSPIPLLLQRAQRLVDKSFIEILQDFAPDGLHQACQIGGINPN